MALASRTYFAPQVFHSHELNARAAAFDGAFELASVGMALLSLDDHRLYRVNREWCELLGWTEAQMLEMTNEDLTHPDDIAASHRRIETMLDGSKLRHQSEKRVRCGDGSYKWMLVSTVLIRTEDDRPLFVFSQIQDITPLKRLQEELAEQATVDSLTGLPNRRSLLDRLADELEQARAGDRPISLLFVDLDDFKVVNDERGHAVGDVLLALAATAMRAAVRPSDVLARLGGDEFVLLCPTDTNESAARAIAERVLCSLRDVGIAASIGAVVIPGAVYLSEAAVLDRADAAMYAAKRRGSAPHIEVVTLS
jgi:diguanylate cyclase (GGDEF)-like protein/PAS domain S-box-containing protein